MYVIIFIIINILLFWSLHLATRFNNETFKMVELIFEGLRHNLIIHLREYCELLAPWKSLALDTGRKLNVHKTSSGRLTYVQFTSFVYGGDSDFYSLSAKPTKWSNTLKIFVGCCRQFVWVCLTIFDYCVWPCLTIFAVHYLQIVESSIQFYNCT